MSIRRLAVGLLAALACGTGAWYALALPPPEPTPAAAPQRAAPPQPVADPCGALRDALDDVISNDEEDRRAWSAVADCLAAGILVGLSREELSLLLGVPGQPVGEYFPGSGLAADDWYYPAGHLPPDMVGGVPNLLLDFDGSGRCARAFTLHTQ